MADITVKIIAMSELGRYLDRVQGAPVPIHVALPLHVPGQDAAGVVDLLRRDEISRLVQRRAHVHTAGRERVRHSARARVAATDDGDERHALPLQSMSVFGSPCSGGSG